METHSLKAAVIVVAALIGGALYLRRRYGSIGDLWAAGARRVLHLRPGDVLKGVMVATALLWIGAWLFTTPAQRAELKVFFNANNPWAPAVQAVDPKTRP